MHFKKALITGGNGNLGRLLANSLRATGVATVQFDIPGSEPENPADEERIVIGDVRDQKLISETFDKHQPDAVFHLASLCLLYTSPSPRDLSTSRMPSSA